MFVYGIKRSHSSKSLSSAQRGFALPELVIIIVSLVLITAAGWYVLDRNHNKTTANPANQVATTASDCTFKLKIGCNWYIGAPVLASLYKASPILAQTFFDHSTTFVAVTDVSQLNNIPKAWRVTPIYTYFDETLLKSDVEQHKLDTRIKGVSLDDEKAVCKVYGKNECTPQAEQASPVSYEQDASQVSAKASLIYLDVGADPDPTNGGNRWHAAAFADYVDSQIQLSEANQTKFTQNSNTYLAGWKSAISTYNSRNYPGVKTTTAKIIDGITAKVPTCNAGTGGCTTYTTANPADIVAAVKNTMNTGIWGYWLNCPAGTTPGPGPCDANDDNAMLSFLQTIQSVYQ